MFDWPDFIAWTVLGGALGFWYAWRRSDKLAKDSKEHALRVTPREFHGQMLAYAFGLKLRAAIFFAALGALAGAAVMLFFDWLSRMA